MKKKLISLLLVLVMPMLVLCGCGTKKSKDYERVPQDRFIEIKRYGDNRDGDYILVVDKETRVIYIRYSCGNHGGLTVMLNADGSPMLYEGEL